MGCRQSHWQVVSCVALVSDCNTSDCNTSHFLSLKDLFLLGRLFILVNISQQGGVWSLL